MRKEHGSSPLQVVGEEVVDAMMPADDFRKLPIPGAEDLANMFLLFGHPNFKAHVDAHIGKTKEYLPKPTTFKEWAEKNKEKLSLK